MNSNEALTVYLTELQQALEKVGKKKLAYRTCRAMLSAAEEYRDAEFNVADDEVMVWSDLHLGHENIIKYSDRPFSNAADMGVELWGNWEAKVAPEDVLVCVGDMAMGPALLDTTWDRIRAAPGRRKILVLGNHDLSGRGLLRVQGFDEVRAVMVSGGEPPLIWTHYPLTTVPEGYVNIHGHVHNSPPRQTRHINVSVEQLQYQPVALTRLRPLAKALVVGEIPPGNTTLERIMAIEAGERA